MLDLVLIGASLAANGLLWFLIGRCNLNRGRAKTIGPPGSNFERIVVEGGRALSLGRKRRGWGLAGMIVGGLVALSGLIFGPLSLELDFAPPRKKEQCLVQPPAPPLIQRETPGE